MPELARETDYVYSRFCICTCTRLRFKTFISSTMSQSFMLAFKPLKNRPYANHALRLLQRIASVKLISKQHLW